MPDQQAFLEERTEVIAAVRRIAAEQGIPPGRIIVVWSDDKVTPDELAMRSVTLLSGLGKSHFQYFKQELTSSVRFEVERRVREAVLAHD